MDDWLVNSLKIFGALLLVFLNGFFVAAEFALVKVRETRVDALVLARRPFAATARWLVQRMDGSLSACQLGITMASLGLGWVGEPAFHHLLQPMLQGAGIRSEEVSHGVAFVVAFTFITALHLVVGEQAPKIFAIRRPETMLLWCAAPLKWFYLATYPLMVSLNLSTAFLLRFVGIKGAGHEVPHTEDEIRALVHQAGTHGELTHAERQLIHAVFEFDDMVCRRIMVPRSDVEFFDINRPISECIAQARRTKHTRYPVCDGSLDNVLGMVHVKDLVGLELDESFNWKSIMRPPRKVPENVPISKVLRQFQASHQLMALVIDEYGTVIGVVTLENVLEQIIGEVDDEFDVEQPPIVSDGPDRWIIQGTAPVEEVARHLDISPGDADVDTFSGLLVHRAERLLNPGDRVELHGYTAEVLEVRDDRAVRIRVSRPAADAADNGRDPRVKT